MLSDGTIHAEPGTLKDGVLYLGPPAFPAVPEHPTECDAKTAWGRLQVILTDFPFATNPSPDAHRAACLASLLTIAGRYAFDGPAPFVLIEANSQASGTRRCLPIRLESMEEHPEDRTGFRIPDLLAYVRFTRPNSFTTP
jgi:hypothetical protein